MRKREGPHQDSQGSVMICAEGDGYSKHGRDLVQAVHAFQPQETGPANQPDPQKKYETDQPSKDIDILDRSRLVCFKSHGGRGCRRGAIAT
jgi:hypothetical protein